MELILNYADGKETVTVPRSWADVTYNKFAELQFREWDCETFYDQVALRIECLLGLEPHNVYNLTSDTFANLTNLLSFSFNYSELSALEVPEKYREFDPGSESWEKLIEYQEIMKQVDGKYFIDDNEPEGVRKEIMNRWSSERFVHGAEVIKIYTGDDYGERPITEGYKLAAFFLKKCQSSSQNFLNSMKKMKTPA